MGSLLGHYRYITFSHLMAIRSEQALGQPMSGAVGTHCNSAKVGSISRREIFTLILTTTRLEPRVISRKSLTHSAIRPCGVP